jgi:1-deoxy-D-xylulose-5-phosphate reductoisomerase
MAGIVGAAGLRSTLAAARAGHRLMIANKESLVMSGPLLIAEARAAGTPDGRADRKRGAG